MEVRVRDGGRITLPVKLRSMLGIREGDSLTIETSGNAIILKPRGVSVKDSWAVAGINHVELEEIEESFGRES